MPADASSGLQRFWRGFPLRTGHTPLNWLLLAVPVAIALELSHASSLAVFVVTAMAIVPLAGVLGEATEDLVHYLGPRVGGLLNATMGNATELIISIFALRAGQLEIVKASISGSIIGNILLVLGMSALAGGVGRQKQEFSRRTAGVNSTMLFIAVVALVMPAVYDLSVFGSLRVEGSRIQHLSLWTSVVLVGVYLLSLVFDLATPLSGPASAHQEEPDRSSKAALVALVIATVLVALLSEILVAQIEPAKQTLGLSDLFMGVVVIAIIGNAAEHATAVVMAVRNKMDLALTIAVGSSAQVALLVAPLLVFISWIMGRPMSLIFTPLEIAGIALAVIIVEMISSDGETTWFEGVQLLAVFLILGAAFYFVPQGGANTLTVPPR